MSQAPLPPGPPLGWSAAEFDKFIIALAAKAGLSVPSTAKLAVAWRWTAGITPFDGATKSVRDNLEGLVKFVNAMKGQLDSVAGQTVKNTADIQALKEAPAARPFP